jgi:hypothetical protein
MPSRPSVVYLTPRTLAEIDENVLAVGEAIDGATKRALSSTGTRSLNRLRETSRQVVRRPRVSFLEWTDPLFCAGHWVPEMIDIAGGIDRLGRPGEDSVRITWDDVHEWNPEIVIVAPCGFGLAEAERLAGELPRSRVRVSFLSTLTLFRATGSALRGWNRVACAHFQRRRQVGSAEISPPAPARSRNSAAPSALNSTHRLYTLRQVPNGNRISRISRAQL